MEADAPNYSASSSNKNITQEGYREKLAIAVIAHDYSFNWVEHTANRDIHRYLNGTVNPISRNTVKSDILKMHTRMKEELKCSLQKIPGRICLTSDMWTSLTTRSFLCLTAHYVDENWKLNSKLLNFSHVRPPHTAFELKTVIYRMLKEWGIDNKIFTITLDNASNMTNMQSELRDQLNGLQALLCAGKYFHIRCCGHILNLIVQDGLKVIRDGVRSVRESVKYVDGSEARKIKFQECIAQAGLKCTKGLWLDVPTRWNSTYMLLDRALFYKQAFVNLTRNDKDYKECPSVENWEKISELAKLLKPFDDITKVFSGTKYPTTNLFFENVWLIHLQLIKLCSTTDEVLSSMGKVMMSKFKKYWEDYNSVLAFGVIMDPRYKLAFVKYCHGMLGVDYSSKWMDVQEDLYLLFDEYKKIDTSQLLATTSTCLVTSEDPTAGFDSCDDDASQSGKSELQQYLEDPRYPRNELVNGVSQPVVLDVLEWWKEYEFRYPRLSRMARDILAIPITSVASESSFSLGGRVLSKWRTCILSDTLEALMTTRNWLYGYKIEEDEENAEDKGEKVSLT